MSAPTEVGRDEAVALADALQATGYRPVGDHDWHRQGHGLVMLGRLGEGIAAWAARKLPPLGVPKASVDHYVTLSGRFELLGQARVVLLARLARAREEA